MSKKEVVAKFLGIAFTVNAVVSIFDDSIPMDDCTFPAIEKLAGYDKQDLSFCLELTRNTSSDKAPKLSFKSRERTKVIRFASLSANLRT
jgi:hypothetical protein